MVMCGTVSRFFVNLSHVHSITQGYPLFLKPARLSMNPKWKFVSSSGMLLDSFSRTCRETSSSSVCNQMKPFI